MIVNLETLMLLFLLIAMILRAPALAALAALAMVLVMGACYVIILSINWWNHAYPHLI
jgi:hypothetical protein